MALGTMGSYFTSFLFVCCAIIRPYLSDAEAKKTVRDVELISGATVAVDLADVQICSGVDRL
jgi:hypothetical protein